MPGVKRGLDGGAGRSLTYAQMRSLKQALDPRNILNPGTVLG
ncbi:FAD-linked oxidase C-terminal domain-containing protein [Phenylobacterium sp.]